MPPIPSLALLLVLFLLVPFMSGRAHRSGQVLTLTRTSAYVSMTLSLWIVGGVLLIVLWIEGDTLASIGLRLGAGPRGITGAALLLGVTAALVGGGLLIVLAAHTILRALRQRESSTLRHLIPRTRRERMMIALLVAPSAGLIEEPLYRGFAITRLALVTGDSWSAALLAAVAFSLGHVYQGPIGVVRSGVLGLLLSVPYIYTGSLLPSILAHAIIDLLTAVCLSRAFIDEPEDPPA